jgi:hypothetical protein
MRTLFTKLRFVEEDARTASRWTWIERIGQDVRYTGRLLRRRPVLSVTAVATLMGMGGRLPSSV